MKKNIQKYFDPRFFSLAKRLSIYFIINNLKDFQTAFCPAFIYLKRIFFLHLQKRKKTECKGTVFPGNPEREFNWTLDSFTSMPLLFSPKNHEKA